MTETLDVPQLAYRDPHPPDRTGWTLTEMQELRQAAMGFYHHYCPWTVPCSTCDRVKWLGPGHRLAYAKPGWHGPLPADLHAEHEARERKAAEEQHAAHIAELALKAQRSANPMWDKVYDAIADNMCGEDSADSATDAVMDLIYGGVW